MDDTYGMSIGDELITPAADETTTDLLDVGTEIGDPLLPDAQTMPTDDGTESDDAAPVPAPPIPAVSVPDLDEPSPSTPVVDTDDAIVAPADDTHGNAAAWTGDWFFQEVDGYCGPSSAAQVVSEYLGLDISDPQQLVNRALELGLFVGGDPTNGMTITSLEVLLEDQGVPCHVESSSMDDLAAKLDDGYGVIAMVDSGELWTPSDEVAEDNKADHVLVVAGIDTDRGIVTLSDPGNPNGNGLEVPISQFEGAWADSGNTMLVADDTDPDLVSGVTADEAAMALQPRPWAMIDLIGT
ncbi:C39 family peptidase (plasmid) [Prescottella equi]|uniref:C39 family peptidase n=1 Tax=Rhodococcus hoagii TaxID=43767 RepID=UPI002574CD43|nr:C39 family peptidase [Prescottella equi]WJJ14378.1 C39 family peptidase [Prescottella equi]